MATRLAERRAWRSSAALAAPALPSAPTVGGGARVCGPRTPRPACSLALALALGPHDPPGVACPRLPIGPHERWEREWCRERAAHARERSASLAPLSPWAAQSALSDVATPRALRDRGAQGGSDARDLHREVTTARRPEDLGEALRDAPAHNLLEVALVLLTPSLCFPRTRSSGGGHQAKAFARLGKFGRPTPRSGPAGQPPPSERRRPPHSPPQAAATRRGLGEAASGPD